MKKFLAALTQDELDFARMILFLEIWQTSGNRAEVLRRLKARRIFWNSRRVSKHARELLENDIRLKIVGMGLGPIRNKRRINHKGA